MKQIYGVLNDRPVIDDYQTITRQLDIYANYLRNMPDDISQEGLGTGLLKVFVGVSDLFIRVGNTFKTNLFKFYKDLKRSEIRFYTESHQLKCLTTEAQIFDKFANLMMDEPSGMKSTFLNAITTVDGNFRSIDLLQIAIGLKAVLEQIRLKITREDDSYKKDLISLRNITNERVRYIQNQIQATDKIFTTQNTNKVVFKALYSSMQDFKKVRQLLLAMEPHLEEASKLVKLIDDMDAIVGDITGFLNEDSDLDKMFVSDLINIVRYLATAFEYYGVLSNRQMALEHNHCLNIDSCYAAIK